MVIVTHTAILQLGQGIAAEGKTECYCPELGIRGQAGRLAGFSLLFMPLKFPPPGQQSTRNKDAGVGPDSKANDQGQGKVLEGFTTEEEEGNQG